MQWYVRVEMAGAPTDEQLADVTEAAEVVYVHADGAAGVVEVCLGVEAPDAVDALSAAIDAVKETPLDGLSRAGVLAAPHRVTIEMVGVRHVTPPIMSTRGVAERLGVSDARVRELKSKGEPGFPHPLSIPGTAGDFYRRVEVEEYAASRRAAPGGAGRPRAGDEELLRDGLRLLAAHADLTDVQCHQIGEAIAAEGGRYVRGKAKLLSEISLRMQKDPDLSDPWRAMNAEDRQRYAEAVMRADEIWRP